MLPAYIIEELRRREREQQRSDELFLDLPIDDPATERDGDRGRSKKRDDDETDDCGVVVVDFVI